MAAVDNVAAYIVKNLGAVGALKLQKLLYYSQAWSLVWDERRLFRNQIRAWANGPVVPSVYRLHRGEFEVSSWPSGKPDALSQDERETVDAVLNYYGKETPQYLSDLTHAEDPWRLARVGMAGGARGNREIPTASMAEYYGSIPHPCEDDIDNAAADAALREDVWHDWDDVKVELDP